MPCGRILQRESLQSDPCNAYVASVMLHTFHCKCISHEELRIVMETENEMCFAVARIIVLGPPAAGKGSISRMICKSLDTEHVTMDSVMKEGDSTLAAEAEEYCRNDSQIPVDLFARLVLSRSFYCFHCAVVHHWSQKLNIKC